MTSYRLCGQPWDYVALPNEVASREGWRMSYAVLGPRERPVVGMRVELDGVDYAVVTWNEATLDSVPDPCGKGRAPGQGVFELVLQPA